MIYLASSWRNEYFPTILETLRYEFEDVFSFRNPRPGNEGFHWSEIDPQWRSWSTRDYESALVHPLARDGFRSDFGAMETSTSCVLLLPCGRSAHLEAGWFIGQKIPTAILIPKPETIEPELMYKMANVVTDDIYRLVIWLKEHEKARAQARKGLDE